MVLYLQTTIQLVVGHLLDTQYVRGWRHLKPGRPPLLQQLGLPSLPLLFPSSVPQSNVY